MNFSQYTTEYQGISANYSPRGKSKKDKIFEHNHPELHSVAMATEKEAKEQEMQKMVKLMHKNQSDTTYSIFLF